MTCTCCNGDLPAREIWEANRDRADECTGSTTPGGRCRAYARDELWSLPTADADDRAFRRQLEWEDQHRH